MALWTPHKPNMTWELYDGVLSTLVEDLTNLALQTAHLDSFFLVIKSGVKGSRKSKLLSELLVKGARGPST